MAEKGNDKDFQMMKEVWRAVQEARQELTKAQERADALAGNVVNLPELPVSSEKDIGAIEYLKERHEFQGLATVSRELPQKTKDILKAKVKKLNDEEDEDGQGMFWF